MANRKKGFTLVELLIVIVVIGVLSAMMMLSSTEAVSSAKAADIVSNLRNWKTATLEWYADNLDKVDEQGRIKKADGNYAYFGNEGTVTMSEIAKYLNGKFEATTGWSTSPNPVKDSSGGKYGTDYNEGSKNSSWKSARWLIMYELPDSLNNSQLKAKLEARAVTTGLVVSKPGEGGVKDGAYKASHKNSRYVGIEVIDFSK